MGLWFNDVGVIRRLINRNGNGNGNGNGRPKRDPQGPYRRVLLVNPPMEAFGAEFLMDDIPIRLEYLAAFIRDKVEAVELLDLTRKSRPFVEHLREFQPDLVGITVNYISVHNTSQDVAAIAKRFGADVVVGGYQVTAVPDDFVKNPNIDYVVRGEGEETLRELLDRPAVDQILGLSWQDGEDVVHNPDRPLLQDLDRIPFPDRRARKARYDSPFMDLECDAGTAYDMIITSRGCYSRCKFCTEPLMTRGTQRFRRPEKVVEELEEMVELHKGAKRLRINISDPNFGGNLRKTEELVDALLEFQQRTPMKVHFFISVRTAFIANNPELVAKMVAAGMDYAFVGMESPKESDLKAISKGGGAQKKQELAAKLLHDNGAAVMSCFLLGLPGQTEEDALDLVRYAKELDLEQAFFSVMLPLPGSTLFDECRAEGLLLEPDYTKFRLWDLPIKHDKLTRAKVRELCVRTNAMWYDDLQLHQEYRRWVNTGRTTKRSLFDFSKKFSVLVGFMSFMGDKATKDFDDMDPGVFVRDMPNPRLRAFTEAHPVHEMLEMTRFLKILGHQKIQVTLDLGGGELISWVLKTTPTAVEYIDSIRGAVDDATVWINIPMEQSSFDPKTIIAKILRDNSSAQARMGLARFIAAVSAEVATSLTGDQITKARCRTANAAAKGKTWLSSKLLNLGA